VRTNKQIHLDNRPSSESNISNFKLVVSETPGLKPHQVLVRHHYLSLDPYLRGRMNDAKSYMPPQALGEPIGGSTVGEVIESTSERFSVGDMVVGYGGCLA
jgi:NADPH-dependent curcumin reductase